MNEPIRGTVKIKPIYVGLSNYQDVQGSVCSTDVVGTPPAIAPASDQIEQTAADMVTNFKQGIAEDFVEVLPPLVVHTQQDLRRLPGEMTYDVDALLVGGIRYQEMRSLANFGLPVLHEPVSSEFLQALRVKKFMKESKFLYIGEIPSFSAPDGPYDFGMIEQRLGVRVQHIETNEFYRHFDRFSDKEVEAELDNWSKDFAQVLEPDHDALLDATRVYLALRYLCQREDANGLTVNCGRFTEERPVVPCLAFDRLIDEGIMCACEGDITAMLSSLMLHAATGQAITMGNFGARPGRFGAKAGEVTIEHDLIPLSMASTRYTIRDYHGRKFGVTGYADIKAGQPMTLLNLHKSLDRIVVIEGMIKGSEDGIHCRVIVHMDVAGDVSKVPELIVGSQHVSMTFGYWLSTLQQVGQLMGFEVRHLE